MNKPHQLLYTSFIAPDFDSAALPELVHRARAKNFTLNVSGLLIFDGICFCGYLEGPTERLDTLVAVLRDDPRHIEFAVNERAVLTTPRRFDGSPLAFASLSDPNALDRLRRAQGELGPSPIELWERLLPALTLET